MILKIILGVKSSAPVLVAEELLAFEDRVLVNLVVVLNIDGAAQIQVPSRSPLLGVSDVGRFAVQSGHSVRMSASIRLACDRGYSFPDSKL